MKNNTIMWIIVGIILIIGGMKMGYIPSIFSLIDGFNYDFNFINTMIGEDNAGNPIYEYNLNSSNFVFNPKPLSFDMKCAAKTTIEDYKGMEGEKFSYYTLQTCPNPKAECWITETNYGSFIHNEEKEIMPGINVKLKSSGFAREKDGSFGVQPQDYNNVFYISIDKSRFNISVVDDRYNIQLKKPYKIKIKVDNDIINLAGGIEYSIKSESFYTGTEFKKVDTVFNKGENIVEIEIPTNEIGRVYITYQPYLVFQTDIIHNVLLEKTVSKEYNIMPYPAINGVSVECIDNRDCENKICNQFKCEENQIIAGGNGIDTTIQTTSQEDKDYTSYYIIGGLAILGAGALLWRKYK
jgi:hypothetical protein